MIGLNALVSLLNLIALSIFFGEYYTNWRQRRKGMVVPSRASLRKRRNALPTPALLNQRQHKSVARKCVTRF